MFGVEVNHPSKRRPFIIMNIPKNTISVPIIVLRSLNFFPSGPWSFIYDDPSPTANNTGAVHSAKIAIASPHNRKFPVFIAINCIDKVNPHGKKKVKAPINGANIGFLVVSVFSDHFLGKCNPVDVIFGANHNRCNHIQSTTIPTTIVNIVVVVSDIAIT